MKVIDILTEGAAGEASERVIKAILGHSTWSAAQKIAFKDSVDLCADALEKMMLKGQDTTTAAATKEAWFAIQPRLHGTPWATRDFVQEVFNVAKAEAEDRVAKKAGTLNPKVEPTTPKTPVATAAKPGLLSPKNLMGTGLAAFLVYDIGGSVAEYNRNQEIFLSRTKLPTTNENYMSPENAMKADVQQKAILVQKIVITMAVPTTVMALSKILVKLGPTAYAWMPNLLWGITPKLWGLVKKLWAVKRPPGMSNKEYNELLKLNEIKWENLSSIAQNGLLTLWLYALNSNERVASTADWQIYNSDGTPTGYTVGTAPGDSARPQGLTPKEMIAWFALNHTYGKGFTTLIVEAFEELFTGTTQKQDIQKAAGQPVTPTNTVGKPPKIKQHDGVTLQGWD